VDFRVLGPLTVVRADREVPLPSTKIRTLLAYLLIHARQVVPPGVLIEELWRDDPPATATNTLQTYVSNLRRLLDDGDASTAGAKLLRRQPGGYRLEITADEVDSARFEAAVGEGRQALRRGAYAEAAQHLRAGLHLWRGPALADVPGAAAEQEAARLHQIRLTAQQLRITADLALGRHGDVVTELERLTADNPWHEQLTADLMVALYRSHRPADALTTYDSYRTRLADELGVDPGPELRDLRQRILVQDRTLRRPARTVDGRSLSEAPPAAPRRSSWRGPIPVSFALLLITVLVLAGILIQRDGGPSAGTATAETLGPVVALTCAEPGCRTHDQKVHVQASVAGPVPAEKELYLMVYSQGDDAWFIYYSIKPDDQGRWTSPLQLGNAKPYPRDRMFTVCAFLLPADSVHVLKSQQIANRGSGLRAGDLPRFREELRCVPAVRPARA
jgi:DNA-binding SARP family transcriptional activator